LSASAAWIFDVTKDADFPRAQLAKDIGVKGGFAFPIVVAGGVAAVMEFFSEQNAAPNARLLDMMQVIGTQLGRVIERARADYALRQSKHTLTETKNFLDSVIENLPSMVFVKDAADLRFVRFNKAGEELTGYSRADLLGKSDYDFFPQEQADFFVARDREGCTVMLDIAKERSNKVHEPFFTPKMPLLDEEDSAPSWGFQRHHQRTAEIELCRPREAKAAAGRRCFLTI
jgi:PAS domain-containing protein